MSNNKSSNLHPWQHLPTGRFAAPSRAGRAGGGNPAPSGRAVDAGKVVDQFLDGEAPAEPPKRRVRRLVPARAALARAAFEAAVAPPLRRRIKRARGLAIVVAVPGATWVAPVADCLRDLMDIAAVEFARDGSDSRKHLPSIGNDDVARALAEGDTVVGVAPEPRRTLPALLVASVDLELTIRHPDAATLAQAMRRCLCGRMPKELSETIAAGLDFQEIVAALRSSTRPVEAIARLQKATQARVATAADGSLPSLQDSTFYGAARDWGLALAVDVDAARRGAIKWDSVDHGCVLHGPPGTGKSWLARMTAQACGLPLIESSVAELFAISSGYLDGVIKAQRALFARAAAAAPCILFLDELDAMPNRATISPRGKDWWLPVINDFLLLLASTPPGVITIGATNRIEDIDEAILRPGRLERAIEIKSPSTAEGLAGILRFQLGPDLARTDLLPLARFGVGATAAVAMEWVRSARRSARTAKREMIAADLLAAIAPPDGRGPEVLRMAATHEAGHAVAMLALGVGSVESISLIPDGSSNGRLTPGAGVDMSLYGRDEIEKFATMLLSGRAAEVILLGRATVGAGGDPQSDLARATRLVASVHSSFGLGEFATYRDAADKAGASLEYDLALRALVERELQRLQDAARGLMARYRDAVQAIAEALLARRFLDGAEIQALFAAASKSPRIRATSSGDVAKLDDAADGAAATSEAPEPTARAASKKGGRP